MRAIPLIVRLIVMMVWVAIAFNSAQAEWIADGDTVYVGANDQQYPLIVSDANGGAIIAWIHGAGFDIYAQRLDMLSNVLWNPGGVPICTAANAQSEHKMVFCDHDSTAIIAWADFRNDHDLNIYAQKVDLNGNVLWTANGVPVCTAGNKQEHLQMIEDGTGGVIIVWEDSRSSIYPHTFAQRLDASGNALWTSGGIEVCIDPHYQYYPYAAPVGDGGAIIAWMDQRAGGIDIYAQRLDGNGNIKWDSSAVPIIAIYNDQRYPRAVPDGSGGAIISCCFESSDRHHDMSAQRIDSLGSVQWGDNGVSVGVTASTHWDHRAISDGDGGVILTWMDQRTGGLDIYAQRLDHDGTAVWEHGSLPICTANNDQHHPRLAPYGNGGAIVSWYDNRSENYNIFAQAINELGAAQWWTNGVPICTAPNLQHNPEIAATSSRDAIIAWHDTRSGNYDIYAQHIEYAVPPAMPENFNATPVYTKDKNGNDSLLVAVALTWTPNQEWDFYRYEIRRATCGHYESDSLLKVTEDTFFLDDAFEWMPNYGYRLIAIDRYGNRSDAATICPTGVDNEVAIPSIVLNQNFPNPFNPSTAISFDLECPAHVTLSIYNIRGELVATVLNRRLPAGRTEILWNARDNRGNPMSSGVYFYRLAAGDAIASKKMILLK